MTDSIFKILTNLVNTYKNTECVTASDFVNKYFYNENQCENTEIIQAFLSFCQHENFVEDIAKLFLKKCTLYRANIQNVKIQIYFVLFRLNSDNIEEIVTHSHYYTKDLLEFLLRDEHHKVLAREGCKYFDNTYVLDDIIKPFLDKLNLIKSAIDKIVDKRSIKISSKVTVPEGFQFNKIFFKPPAPPTNTPIDSRIFNASKPPVSTQIPHVRTLKKIEEECVKNRKKAEKLLEESSNVPKHLSEPKKLPQQPHDPQPMPMPMPMMLKPVPINRDIPIKENLTTVLRQASRLLKQQEAEIKSLDEILKGGCALHEIEQLEEGYRKHLNQQEVENIQRKRLQGLLSYEEAIIAKKTLFNENKKKVEDFKTSRAKLLQQLEEWKSQEQEKIKEYVEKCHMSKKDLKEIEKQHLEEKQKKVRMQQYETKEMLEKAYKQKEKELAKKIELIKEIKAIHEASIRMNAKKEFDPTETPNLGLFCEMSIAELQERLIIMEMRIKEELVAKRRQILDKKTKQQEEIENLRNFIAQNRRMSDRKTKTVPIFSPKLERSPSLLRLEKLLHDKRSLRMKIT